MADSNSTDPKASAAKADEAKASDANARGTKPGAADAAAGNAGAANAGAPKTGSVKVGPVKPPVLDLTARSVGPEAAKPEAGKAAPETPAASDSPRPSASDASGAGKAASGDAAGKAKADQKPISPPAGTSGPASPPAGRPGFGFGAAIVGGLLGLGAAYGLAAAGLWPAAPVQSAVADPRLAAHERAIPELETVTQTTQDELATLTQRVASLEQVPAEEATNAPAPTAEVPDVSADLAALGARIDALAEAPAPEADTATLDALRSDFAALGSRIDELAARLGSAEAGLRSLDTSVSQTSAALAAQPSDIGAVLQLPLILSSFETAFATGRPYATELAALRAAVPDADIPTLIANQADQGLTRPEMIVQRFDNVLPAILAGRPADPNAPWQAGALDWFAGAIALRPTDEMAGDAPEAIASRLVGAMERREFASALSLLESLPVPMQAAAGDVPGLLAQQAAAERFLQDLRDAALSGEVAR